MRRYSPHHHKTDIFLCVFVVKSINHKAKFTKGKIEPTSGGCMSAAHETIKTRLCVSHGIFRRRLTNGTKSGTMPIILSVVCA
jgi:hypothetical protein